MPESLSEPPNSNNSGSVSFWFEWRMQYLKHPRHSDAAFHFSNNWKMKWASKLISVWSQQRQVVANIGLMVTLLWQAESEVSSSGFYKCWGGKRRNINCSKQWYDTERVSHTLKCNDLVIVILKFHIKHTSSETDKCADAFSDEHPKTSHLANSAQRNLGCFWYLLVWFIWIIPIVWGFSFLLH